MFSMQKLLVAVSTGASEMTSTLQLQVGVKEGRNGTLAPVFASIRVPGKPQSILEAIPILASQKSITWRLPVEKVTNVVDGQGIEIRFRVSPIMSGERAAVLIAYFYGFGMPAIEREAIETHLKACGVTPVSNATAVPNEAETAPTEETPTTPNVNARNEVLQTAQAQADATAKSKKRQPA